MKSEHLPWLILFSLLLSPLKVLAEPQSIGEAKVHQAFEHYKTTVQAVQRAPTDEEVASYILSLLSNNGKVVLANIAAINDEPLTARLAQTVDEINAEDEKRQAAIEKRYCVLAMNDSVPDQTFVDTFTAKVAGNRRATLNRLKHDLPAGIVASLQRQEDKFAREIKFYESTGDEAAYFADIADVLRDAVRKKCEYDLSIR